MAYTREEVMMLREMEFKFEREGLFEVGEELAITETVLESFIFYTLEHSYGMSGNIPLSEPLLSRKGRVVRIEEKSSGMYAILAFEE